MIGKTLFFIACACALTLTACSDDATPVSQTAAVSGQLSSITVASVGLRAKTITHVMAVSPSTDPTYFVSAVDASGSFSLTVDSGKPYIIVFVSQNGVLTGEDMIVGINRIASSDLDTLPIARSGTVDLGTVGIATGVATSSSSDTDLLSDMGITSAEASYIGDVDDLALRLANPDVDGNGVIDHLENKMFTMSFHIRADTKLSGVNITVADITGQFANEALVTLSWTLGSAYAVYPSTFDSTEYVNSNSLVLINSGVFDDGVTTHAPTSMSSSPFNDMRQWGPDYNMVTGELGGADVSTKFVYELGSPTKRLTFSNIRTKTIAQLNADGVMLPFLSFTESSGVITALNYKWMKRAGGAWVQATATEVSLLVLDESPYLVIYTARSGNDQGMGYSIPTTAATGTILASSGEPLGSSAVVLTQANICNMALSYDDKMGLRIFAGAPVPNGAVCN